MRQKILESDIDTSGPVFYPGDCDIEGDIPADANVTIEGSAHVSGNICKGAHVTVGGALVASGIEEHAHVKAQALRLTQNKNIPSHSRIDIKKALKAEYIGIGVTIDASAVEALTVGEYSYITSHSGNIVLSNLSHDVTLNAANHLGFGKSSDRLHAYAGNIACFEAMGDACTLRAGYIEGTEKDHPSIGRHSLLQSTRGNIQLKNIGAYSTVSSATDLFIFGRIGHEVSLAYRGECEKKQAVRKKTRYCERPIGAGISYNQHTKTYTVPSALLDKESPHYNLPLLCALSSLKYCEQSEHVTETYGMPEKPTGQDRKLPSDFHVFPDGTISTLTTLSVGENEESQQAELQDAIYSYIRDHSSDQNRGR